MARWQKRARAALGVFAVSFAIVLWLMMGERQAPAPAPVQPVQPVNHVVEPDRSRQQPRDQRNAITARMKIRRSVQRSR